MSFHFLQSLYYLSLIGEGNGNPLQYPCLENARDSGGWWVVVYGVAQIRTRLKQFSSSSPWSVCHHGHPPTVMWVKWMLLSHVQLLATPWPMAHCSLPGSSIHGVLQARILECVAIPSPRIFLTHGLNPGLPHCRRTLYLLSHQNWLVITCTCNHHRSLCLFCLLMW